MKAYLNLNMSKKVYNNIKDLLIVIDKYISPRLVYIPYTVQNRLLNCRLAEKLIAALI